MIITANGENQPDCLFCKFATKQLEPAILFENEKVIAFLDINPAGTQEGHTLVLPKKHFENIFDVNEDLLRETIAATKKIAIAVKKISGAEGVNILQNNGKAAGQLINHLHFHVIPRKLGDGIRFDENRRKTKPLELIEVAKVIKEELK